MGRFDHTAREMHPARHGRGRRRPPDQQTPVIDGLDHRRYPPAAEVDVIHAAIPRLRRALDRLDLPDDGPTRTPANLQGDIIRASDDRLQSRYGRG
ncbi:hypothetical protein [Actinophytocola sediminis]